MNKMQNPTEVKLSVPWGYIAGKIYGCAKKEKRILLVHGIYDNAGAFDRLMEYLPQDYQYVSIDLPGHGLSSHFPSGQPLNFLDYVHSLSLVLDALQWQTCVYLAHSFGVHLGSYFSILYPGRFQKIIGIDGFLPFLVDDTVSYIRKIYNLYSYPLESEKLYTRDDIIYAFQFRRKETLTMDAAEALFERGVTKVDSLYRYNRDSRLRSFMRPIFTAEQHKEIFSKFSTKTLLIIPDYSSTIHLKLVKLSDESKLSIVFVKGNHDVHNNYPERVAPHICKFLNNDLQSKL